MSKSNRQAAVRMARLNDCLLSFTPYPMENVRRLTALCGELLSASHAYYSWIEHGMLYTPGVWHAAVLKKGAGAKPALPPPHLDHSAIDPPEGRIAYDAIRNSAESLVVFPNLAETVYAHKDPLISLSGARCFVGRTVRSEGRTVGCLAVLFADARVLNEDDIQFLSITASAIEVEERRKRLEIEREKLIQELQEALANIKRLSGLLPICASCKKIRDDQGYWNRLEVFLHEHSEAEFTHSICPECFNKLYKDIKPRSEEKAAS